MEKLTKRMNQIHGVLAEHDQTDFEGLQEHTDKLREVKTEVEQLEERWLELSEKLS